MSYGIDGSVQSSKVKVAVKLELDRIQLAMMQFINEQLIPEMQGCLDAACRDVLTVEKWKPQIEYQLRRGIEAMMQECIKASIENNWELRRQLTYLMSEEMKNSLEKYIQHIKPENLPTYKPEENPDDLDGSLHV